jgi:5'-phosphate synthase pdxT subunit
VEILASVDGHGVAARQGRMLAVAFHAELSDDERVHRMFLALVRDARQAFSAKAK